MRQIFCNLLFIICLLTGSPAWAAALNLDSFSPQGEVERLTQVVVRFNAPMRALGDMSQDAATSPLLVSLSADYKTPPPPGDYRWLDERTLAYLLQSPQRQALTLYCKVPAGIASPAGAVLAQDVSWVVSTPSIAVLESRPEQGEALGNRGNVSLVVNQPLDMDSLRAHTSYMVDGREVAWQAREEAVPSWVDPSQQLSRTYQFVAENELAVNQKIELVLNPGLRSPEGLTPLNKRLSFSYLSFAPLALEDFHMESSQADTKLYNPESGLALSFNNPVRGGLLREKMLLEVKQGNDYQPLDFSVSDDAEKYVYVNTVFAPRQTYRLTLRAGLSDEFGGILAEDKVIQLRTGDYNPRLHTAQGEVVVEGQFPASQVVWLRNIRSFKVTLDYYAKDKVWQVYDWFSGNYWKEKATPPRSSIHKAHLLNAPVQPNKPYAYELDIVKLLGSKPMDDGVVLLTFEYQLPGADMKTIQRSLVQHSDLGLSLKYGYSNSLAWVTSLKDGEPLSGVELLLMDRRGRLLWQGHSDQDGLAQMPGVDTLQQQAWREGDSQWGYPGVMLLARRDGQLAVLNTFITFSSLRYATDFYPSQNLGQGDSMLMHVITQLPLYTPGARVNYLVYLRGLENDVVRAMELKNVTVVIKDPAGKVVHQATGDMNSFGSFSGSFMLDEAARLGAYDLFLTWPDNKGAISQYGAFNVQYYRTPDYQVKLNLHDDVVDAQAGYFFGSPVANAPVKLLFSQQPVYYAPSLLDSYVVGSGIYENDEDDGAPVSLGVREGRLDAQGRASFSLPVWQPEGNRQLTRMLSVKAEVSDASGQVVSGHASRLMHPARYYVGLKAPYLAQAGSSFEINLLAATSNNKPAPELPVQISLLRRQWDMARERGVEGFYQIVSSYTDTQVLNMDVSLPGGGGVFTLNAPDEAGEYIIQTRVGDADGGEQITRSYMYVYGKGFSPWQRFSDNSLQLVPEKSALKAGQSARILVQNPFQQATALITVEREGISRQWVESFNNSAPVVEVPVIATDAPNTYVSVLLVRGRNGQPPVSGPDLAKPQVRLGMVQLKVEDNDGLTVEVEPSARKFKPGQQVDVAVTVGGNAPPYQVTLLAVDERVLSVAGKDNYDPRPGMQRELALRVVSEDSRVNIIDQRFKSGLKGEDAAGGGGLSSLGMLRSKFEPDVYWLAQGITDSQGKLNASFSLPDSLTSYRVVAVAADKTSLFGVGSSNVVATKPLQLLSSLPAFAVAGDKFTARFIVQNLSDQPGSATVELAVEGLELNGPARQRVELAAGQMKSVDFVCQAPLNISGQAGFVLKAAMNGQEDAARFSLPLLAASQTYSAASAGVVKPGQPASVGIQPPDNASRDLTSLAISLALTPVSSLSWPVSYLENYPWTCLEQRLSKALGMAFSHSRAGMLGITPQGDELERIKAIMASIGNFQGDSGQMYLWENFGGFANYFYPYLTAYTLLAGKAIEQMSGVAMDKAVEQQARQFLREALNNKNTSISVKAMIIWQLAQGQQAGNLKAELNSLLRELKGQDPFTLACLLLAAKAMNDKPLMSDLVVRLDKGRVVSGTHLHFSRVSSHAARLSMGSDLRDNAMVLLALSQAAPNYAGLEGLALWLADKAGASRWLNTQEAAFTLLAMDAYLENLKPQAGVKARVSLAGEELLAHSFAQLSDPPLNRSFTGITPGALSISSENGPLYWASRLQYTLPNARAENAGFGVSHAISPLSNDQRAVAGDAGINTVELGQVVQCTVTLMVPESRLHVLVFDPIPAGLEPLDATSLSVLENPDYVWQWVEMRRDGLVLYAWDLEPGIYTYSYKLRASVPGRFVWRGAQAEEMYQPENFGRGAGGTFTVE